MSTVRINALYPTFMGEQNLKGIGYPSLFLRLAGCHIRCYLKTKGMLCDTPEALEAGSGDEMTLFELKDRIKAMRRETGGIDMVCLTGGDPLWRKKSDLIDLFKMLQDVMKYVVVETSGTIDWMPYAEIFPNVSWVVDWKTPSAGIEERLNKVGQNLTQMTDRDYIKFVVADEKDFSYFLACYEKILQAQCKAHVVVGPFWGEDSLTTFEIFERLKSSRILGRVEINMQTHKLAVSANVKTEIPRLI